MYKLLNGSFNQLLIIYYNVYPDQLAIIRTKKKGKTFPHQLSLENRTEKKGRTFIFPAPTQPVNRTQKMDRTFIFPAPTQPAN